ncbi:MAG: DUF2628 domain-containing protein [Cytophagia bacterium]|jgi:DNA-directed RNA polymerase subunit RPC12/RpoP|nr:DUF2628 domain-containing protein [Cytophagia bacterium]
MTKRIKGIRLKFYCYNCGSEINTSNKEVGEKVHCNNCHTELLIPATAKVTEKNEVLKFYCFKCGSEITTTHYEAGQNTACTQCSQQLIIPSFDKVSPDKDINIENSNGGKIRKEIDGYRCNNCKAKVKKNDSSCWKCDIEFSGDPIDCIIKSYAVPVQNYSDSTSTKRFNIYKNEAGHFDVVKIGWSWPAFFFSWIWCLYKNILNYGILILTINLFFPFYYGVSDLITILIGWVTMIWIGTNGNKYLEKQLLESGYRYFKTISAKNHESALLLSDNIS